jgi:hypothetical protein
MRLGKKLAVGEIVEPVPAEDPPLAPPGPEPAAPVRAEEPTTVAVPVEP